jgi:hypothetical protein
MITRHAYDNLENRLNGIVTRSDIEHIDKISATLTHRKYYIRIKQMGRRIYLSDTSGDCVTAIVEGNNVVTVMLSGNEQRWSDGTFKVLLTR